MSVRYEALTPADASAMTAEARMRLLSGLKRFFHSKRAEGLVSGQVHLQTPVKDGCMVGTSVLRGALRNDRMIVVN